ncbi:MAG: DoxX family protein [Pseudomonadota bacterium]
MTRIIDSIVKLLERIPLSLISLLARVIVGLVFFNSGLTKIDGFALKDSTFYLFEEEYKVPLIPPVLAAYMATAAELTMPWLLWLGLGARFAALALLAMTVVIQTFVYPEAYITHGLWAIALLLIVRFGAGAISIDHLIRTRHDESGLLSRESMWRL